MKEKNHAWARVASIAAALLLVVSIGTASAQYRDDYDRSHGRSAYNDQYIFGFTKAAADMDAPAPVRIALFPVTVVLDVALLPAEVIGGFFG